MGKALLDDLQKLLGGLNTRKLIRLKTLFTMAGKSLFLFKGMLYLENQSLPAWAPTGHITGARTGPKLLLLSHLPLSALIPPPQTIWTHFSPGNNQVYNLRALCSSWRRLIKCLYKRINQEFILSIWTHNIFFEWHQAPWLLSCGQATNKSTIGVFTLKIIEKLFPLIKVIMAN